MKHVRRFLSASLLCLFVPAFAARGDEQPAAEKFEPLFNGTNLAGWKPVNDGAFFVTNGVLRVEGGNGWLRTEREFGDFVLEAEWRGLETNYNSGFFIRAPIEGRPWATNVWQVNTKQGAIGELLQGSRKVVPARTPPRPAGDWVRFRIKARGRRLTLDVDGSRVWEFAELDAVRGCVGIQAEGKAMEVRNIRVLELGAAAAK